MIRPYMSHKICPTGSWGLLSSLTALACPIDWIGRVLNKYFTTQLLVLGPAGIVRSLSLSAGVAHSKRSLNGGVHK